MTSFGYRSNPRYAIKECSSCGTLYTRDYVCSIGNVEDKILVPKPPKNCDNGSFVDKIIFDLNRAPDSPHLHTISPNQLHCFHCKDVLRDGEACKRCTCAKCRSVLGKGLCYICGHNQNSLNDSPSISETSLHSPSNINHCCYECRDLLDGIFCKRCTCAKCRSVLGKGLCYICGHNQNSLNDSPSISETSLHSPSNINHCCYECRDLLDGIFCKRCTCKSCGKDAHIGYNCPSKVPVISNPEPCNNKTIDELPQTLPIFHPTFHSEVESPFTLDSTPTYVNESPNVFNPPPQPPVYPCEFCGNDAYYGQYCTPQAPFIYPEPCYNQDFNFPQDFKMFHNNILVVMIAGLLMTLTNQYTVDHPIFNAHNEYLDSQIQFNSTLARITDQMTSITSLCEMACQVVQKKLEKKQIEEERAAKAKYWKLLVCYDDDDDEERSDSLDDNIISGLPMFSAITPNEPVLSTEEPDNSLSMGDEHLDTIPAMESDEVIKSSVKNLIPILNESEGIPEHKCDVPFHDNYPPLDVSKDQIEDFSKSNEAFSLIDDDSFSIDDIDYVEASPPDSELISSEAMEIVIPEIGGIDDDILLMIKDDILHEKILNVNLLIAKIEALTANPTPSFDCKTKSSSTSLNSLLEETNTFDNSLPEFETFCFDVEEISSGSTTTHPDLSLPEYEAFYDDHVKEISSGSPTTHFDSFFMLRSSLIFRSIYFLLPIGVILMRSPMNSFPSYRHQSTIVSFSRLNQTQGISPRMWWRIFLQQKNHKFLLLCPPILPFN
nr:hypothetical protein [Tanacetum cinerariifolium]